MSDEFHHPHDTPVSAGLRFLSELIAWFVWPAPASGLAVGIVGENVHGVTLGCVNGDPEIEIGQHIFVGSKATWEVMPEGVTAFEEGPSNSP